MKNKELFLQIVRGYATVLRIGILLALLMPVSVEAIEADWGWFLMDNYLILVVIFFVMLLSSPTVVLIQLKKNPCFTQKKVIWREVSTLCFTGGTISIVVFFSILGLGELSFKRPMWASYM